MDFYPYIKKYLSLDNQMKTQSFCSPYLSTNTGKKFRLVGYLSGPRAKWIRLCLIQQFLLPTNCLFPAPVDSKTWVVTKAIQAFFFQN